MFRHFAKIAFRNLGRDKISSSFSIFGLSIAMGFSFLIMLYIMNEWKFDKYHPNYQDIYRVNINMGEWKLPISPPLLSDVLNNKLPEISYATSLYEIKGYQGGYTISRQMELFTIESFKVIDKHYFKLFNIDIIEGSRDALFQDPQSILISNKLKEKIFGDQFHLGDILEVHNHGDTFLLTVRGIFLNNASSSFFQPQIIGNDGLLPKEMIDSWSALNATTFVNTVFRNNIVGIEADMEALMNDESGQEWDVWLQPLKDIYLHSEEMMMYSGKRGNRIWTQVAGLIGLIFLLTASINYNSISSARTAGRMKEVAIKKIHGAGRGSFLKQGISESFIIAICAIPLALVITEVFTPAIGRLFQTDIQLPGSLYWKFVVGMIIVVILVTSLTGLYTSIYLSRILPTRVLQKNRGRKKILIRQIILGFQGFLFVSLVIFSLMINKQNRFFDSADLGYNIENIETIDIPGNISNASQISTFIDDLKKHPEIRDFTTSKTGIFTKGIMRQSVPSIDNEDNMIPVTIFSVDKNYIEFMEIETFSGRSFSPEYQNESGKVIINEKACDLIGYKGDPLGQKLFGGEIIGVVKDFHNQSLHNAISPIAFVVKKDSIIPEKLLFKFDKNLTKGSLSLLEEKWRSHFPEERFNYNILTDIVKEKYNDDRRFGQIITLLTLIAILIASLGFFGLSWLVVQKRKKEVAVRKICGSSNTNIAKLFIRQFIFQFLVAAILAWPVSYIIISKWLERYNYKTIITPDVFITGTLIGLIIIMLTVGINIFSVSKTNPVVTLRND